MSPRQRFHVMRGLLAAAWLLGFAGSAHAECAWVLWNKITVMADGRDVHASWQLIAAFSVHEECLVKEKWFDQRHGGVVPETPDRPAPPPGVDRATVSRSFQCLPDTIDPRGPKAK